MKTSRQSLNALLLLAAASSSVAFQLGHTPSFGTSVSSTTTNRRNHLSRFVYEHDVKAKEGSQVTLFATVEETATDSGLDEGILSRITDATQESKQWAEDFDLSDESGAAFFALFSGIRSSAALGLKGKPFHLKSSDVLKAMESSDDETGAFSGFFTFDDLTKALEEDFLDADRGSTDNRQGWKVSGTMNHAECKMQIDFCTRTSSSKWICVCVQFLLW